MSDGKELGDFLRTRRAKVSPADVGLNVGSRRRVAGLRREELAQLAGISVEYYQRLEQGRATRPSDEVLEAIADILALSEAEHAHLHQLASSRARRRRTSGTGAAVAVSRTVRPKLDQLLGLMAKVPAVVIDDRFEVVAMNEPARWLFPGVVDMPDDDRNLARFLFLDPAARAFYVEWDDVAAATVAQLRFTTGRFPNDPAVSDLVAELSDGSPEFCDLWARGDVEIRTHGAKTIYHPTLGILCMDYENLEVAGAERQRIVAFSVEPDSPSAAAYGLLGTEIETGVEVPRSATTR